MNEGKGRRMVAAWLVFCQLLLTMGGVSPAWAQSEDRTPPLIEFQPLGEGRRGDTQVFSARVSDDTGVESVTLRYRLDASEPYRTLPMNPLGETDIYTASIDGGPATDAASIQYYIEARDSAGNRQIEGFAFDPLVRTLVEPGIPLANADPASEGPATGLSTRQKILYGVLGVVVVGAIAAAAGGGGGSDGGRPLGDDTDVPITVVVDPL